MKKVLYSLCLLIAITGLCVCEFTETQNGITIECEDSVMALTEDPKVSFSVKCSTTGSIDDVVVGKWLTYKKIDQETGRGIEERRNGDDNKPYIVYSRADFPEQLTTASNGRYSVKKDDTMVEVTVTDAEVPDSGLWFCGTTDTTYEDFNIRESPFCNIFVVGLPNITIYNDDTKDLLGESVTIGPEVETYPITVKVEMKNVVEDKLEILIAGEDVTSNFDKNFPSEFKGRFEGGYNSYFYSWRYTGTFPVNDETRNTGVEVNVGMSPVGGTTTKSLRIYSNYKPYKVSCGAFKREENKATITCEGEMYPMGNVTWSTPLGNDITVSEGTVEKGNLTAVNTISGVQVTSTLTIDADEDANLYGTYNATFRNQYGQVSKGHVEEQQVNQGEVAKMTLPLVVFMVLSSLIY